MNSLLTIALMFKVLDQATAPVRKINETLDATGKSLDQAAGKSTALNNGIGRLGSGAAVAGRVAAGVDRIGKAAEAATAKLDALQKKTEKIGESAQKLDGLGRPMAATGAVGTVGIEKTIEDFANLEEAQKRLRTTLMDQSGRVGPEFEKLNALAEKLGTDLPGSTKDMIQMFIALREQGVQTRYILGGTGEAAANFAALMKLGFAESATHVAKFSESMGVSDTEMVRFMDLLQRLKYSSGVEVGDLAYTFKYAGGALKLLGLQGLDAARDFSTVVGMLAAAGIEGSTAGTNMAQALSRMAEIGHRLDKKSIKKMVGPILDKYNIKLDFFTAAGEFKGLRPMVAELEKLKVLNPQEQIITLKKLFGDEAARPLAVLLKSGVAGYDEMLSRIMKQAAMQIKIREIMSGTKMQWETMSGTVQNLTAHIGGVFAGLIRLPALLGRLNELFGKLDSWTLLHPKTAGIIAGVVLGVVGLSVAGGALLLTMAGLGATVPRALEALTVLGRGATWAAGRFTALHMAMQRKWVLNRLPDGMFGDVIPGATKAQGGIRGVIAATRLWSATQLAGLKISYLAAGGLTGLGRSFAGGLVSGIRLGIGAVRAFSIALLTTPIGWLGIAVGITALLIYRYWRPISGFFKGLWAGIKEGLKGLEPAWNEFRKYALVVRPLFEPLFALGRLIKALIGPVDASGKAAENMGLRFGRAIGRILTSVLTLPGQMLAAGMNIITSLTDGMVKMINKPVQVIDRLAKRIRGFLPFSPAKEGALRDINCVRIVETIAESMKPAPMMNAMRTITAATILAATPAMAVNPSWTSAQAAMMQRRAAQVTTQRINQVATPAKLPLFSNQTQTVSQRLNRAAVPVIPDQLQRINQVATPAKPPVTAARPLLNQQPPAMETANASQSRAVPLPVAALARPAAPATAGAMTVTFSPQITVQGAANPEQTQTAVNQAIQLSFAEFERLMQRYETQRQRRSF